MAPSIWQILIVLLIVLVIFGKKLPSLTSLGKDLGGALRKASRARKIRRPSLGRPSMPIRQNSCPRGRKRLKARPRAAPILKWTMLAGFASRAIR